MCGIAGFTRFHRAIGEKSDLKRMADSLVHRGPDAGGLLVDGSVALAHRRLSIIDLSAAANQPMDSADGRYALVFNGEIYNFRSVRNELVERGLTFKTNSDSEVLLQAYQYYGYDCLHHLNGMFAFAIWDRKQESLFIARDRLGKKPLYFASIGSDVAFASELKALMKLPGFSPRIREESVRDFFAYQYVPDPYTIFEGVSKLSPGHFMVTNRDGSRISRYWDVRFSDSKCMNEDALCDELLELLDDATKIRMESDVPLGAFLSGGVDSSAVVASMAQAANARIMTCSIGFDSDRFDEVEFARAIAQRFDTQHNVLKVEGDVTSSVPQIARFFDEPFADPSLVPTFFVCKLARQKVTVALSGDGGDENFAGYQKYRVDAREARLRSSIPSLFRAAIPNTLIRALEKSTAPVFRKGGTLLRSISSDPAMAFYHTNAFMRDSEWRRLARKDVVRRLSDYHPGIRTIEHYRAAGTDDHLSRVLYADIKTYLAGGILVKVDRMSMANSLEVRAPLLDYRIVEFAAKLPPAFKLRGEQKKYLLRQALRKRLPAQILDRKKMGFSVPLAHWLGGPLRPMVESAVMSKTGGLSEYFDTTELTDYWRGFLNGNHAAASPIWSFLMFDLWWNQYVADRR